MQKITPFLWFNDNLEDAINFYTSIFNDGKITRINRLPDGRTTMGIFQLAGSDFYALNGGPMFSFTPSVSFFVTCETKEEIDTLWGALSNGGSALMPMSKYPFSEQYGWVKDKFGISWQLNLTGAKQQVTPFLMFSGALHGQAEEAVNLYGSLFPNSSIIRLERCVGGEPGTEGTVTHEAFKLAGQTFMAMDSNEDHPFSFTPAISFFVNCTTQEEVDFFWDKLSEGGRTDRCGWLSDKYGVSWQIVPQALNEQLADPTRSKRVMDAMLKMNKIIIQDLLDA